jgi:hypothetical protein
MFQRSQNCAPFADESFFKILTSQLEGSKLAALAEILGQ